MNKFGSGSMIIRKDPINNVKRENSIWDVISYLVHDVHSLVDDETTSS